MSVTADVTVKRLEEKAPGDGSPGGWVPEIVYHLIAKDIPEKPEYVFGLRLQGTFVLRRLVVGRWSEENHLPGTPDAEFDAWDVAVKVDRKDVYLRGRESLLYELYPTSWPPPDRPVVIRRGQLVRISVFPRRPEPRPTRFECILRGSEDLALTVPTIGGSS